MSSVLCHGYSPLCPSAPVSRSVECHHSMFREIYRLYNCFVREKCNSSLEQAFALTFCLLPTPPRSAMKCRKMSLALSATEARSRPETCRPAQHACREEVPCRPKPIRFLKTVESPRPDRQRQICQRWYRGEHRKPRSSFWGKHGKRIDWFKPYTKVKNTSFKGKRADQVVRGRPDQRLLQLHRPPSEDAWRAGRHHLGRRQSLYRQEDHLQRALRPCLPSWRTC